MSKVRNPALKNLSMHINLITGNIISGIFEDKEFASSLVKLPVNMDLAEHTGIISSSAFAACPWNRTSRANPHKKRKSSDPNSTIRYSETNGFSDLFSVAADPFTQNLSGAASSTVACRITGQASSKQDCSFGETSDDWIPSRNGFHCR